MKLKLLKTMDTLSGISNILLIVLLVFEIGFKLSFNEPGMYLNLHQSIFTYFFVDLILRLILQKNRVTYLLTHPTELLILWPLLPILTDTLSSLLFSQVAIIGILIGRLGHSQSLLKSLKVNPAQSLLLGFLFIIFIGSLLLSLPFATYNHEQFAYIDALFTSTSAVCVTGLATKNIAETFTVFGQSIILLLIQIGGLGIMAFSAILALFINKKFSHKDTQALKESYATIQTKDTFRIITAIFKYTLIFEAIGAVILFIGWHQQFSSVGDAIFASVFHSISAFCNAGFSIFNNSLTAFANDPLILLTICALIIIGGLGFPVIFDIFSKKQGSKRLKLQSKLSLSVTAILLVIGTLVILLTEMKHGLAGFTMPEQVLNAFFHSVSARTAGFNTVDLTTFHQATILMLISLMFIGASPGSTGGGIKTTTFGISIIGLYTTLRGIPKTRLFNRRISEETSHKALSLITISIIMIFTSFFVILLSESTHFINGFFETVSAFSTVGLSLGLTENLSNLGKGIIMVVMFIGRVGPLTVGFAFTSKKIERNFDYPEERILIT